MIKFTRSHGIGNDYLILDTMEPSLALTPDRVRLLCHPHLGMGGDGILLPVPGPGGGAGVRIFNPDGSEAEKSGNGLRIFARALYDRGLLEQPKTLFTRGGPVQAQASQTLEGKLLLAIDMGIPERRPAHIPFLWEGSEALDISLPLPNTTLVGSAVSMGNPHFVCFVDDLMAVDLERLGPRVENHPWFPHRTNVQFAQVVHREEVHVRIWERGVGTTLASGNSSCAVVAAGQWTHRLGDRVEVVMTGGRLEVSLEPDGQLRQRGPVTVIARGELGADLEAELRALPEGREAD